MFVFSDDLDLLQRNRDTIRSLIMIEEALAARFYGLEKPIRGMILAAASCEPLILVGPAGTAKSRLIRTFCQLAGISKYHEEEEQHVTKDYYFEYLLTQFTEPSELFGYLNLRSITQSEGEIFRDDAGMMQHAQVVFLDEVFNASSAILNSLLTFMNERRYHDRGKVHEVPMKLLFGASNKVPEAAELAALFDRFVLRVEVGNSPSDDAEIRRLVSAGWQETYGKPHQASDIQTGLLDRLPRISQSINDATQSGHIEINSGSSDFARLSQFVADSRRLDRQNMSNRRIIKYVRLILIEALIAAVRNDAPKLEVAPEHMKVLVDFGLNPGHGSHEERMRQHFDSGA